MITVFDASAVVELLLQTPAAIPHTPRLLGLEAACHVPHLIDVEVTQALRRLCATQEIDDQRALGALADLEDLPLERHPHELLLPRAWELRRNLTIYDGVYVALAELLEAPLLTRDSRLAKAPGHAALVELF
jgi:predicted nucleic acid-binding protein